jgi:hypothetical protein
MPLTRLFIVSMNYQSPASSLRSSRSLVSRLFSRSIGPYTRVLFGST